MRFRPPLSFVLFSLGVACDAAVDEPSERTASSSSTEAEPAAPLATPTEARTVRAGVARPLDTDVTGLALIDRVDVANEASEREHDYVIENATFAGVREFEGTTTNVAYAEDGRAMKASEAFEIKVAPNRENLLIRAFDTLAKDQKVRVLVDGKTAGEWALPDSDSRYGEAVFPLSASLVGERSELTIKFEYISGVPDTNSFVYWVYAKPDRALDEPLSTDTAGLTLIDRLDVGTETDEASHQYAIDKPSYFGVQQFEWPGDSTPFLENGRAHTSFESFRMKVRPNRDHVLVKAFDTYSKNQVVRVLVNGAPVGDWSFSDGEERYAESSFRIPARFIGDENQAEIRVEFVSASLDANSFLYWLYVDSGTRH